MRLRGRMAQKALNAGGGAATGLAIVAPLRVRPLRTGVPASRIGWDLRPAALHGEARS